MKMHLHMVTPKNNLPFGNDTILMLKGYCPGHAVYAFSQEKQTFVGRGCVVELLTDIDKRTYKEVQEVFHKDFYMEDKSQYRYTFEHNNSLVSVIIDNYNEHLQINPDVEVFDSMKDEDV